ncbi:MAG: gamma-glutamyltransferase [Ignavibacteria bacterium]
MQPSAFTKFGFAGFCLLWSLAWAQSPAQPEAASGFVPQPPVVAQRYLAVTSNEHATRAALEMLRLGGSAVDAAIATQLALTVVEPQSSGIGGGAFLLHWDAARRQATAFDGRETAPRAATPVRFAGAKFRDVVATGKSIGTPGVVALLAEAHARYGRLPWSRLFEPAMRLAEFGFPVSPRLHQLLRDDAFLRGDPGARRLYYHADGTALAAGQVLKNPALAATLRQIALGGADAFYRGPLAVDIAAAARARGGDLDVADLADYRAKQREPVCAQYRAWRICGMPPPSSGGVTVLQMLGLLQRAPFDRAAPMSAQAVHWFGEAGRLAFADRKRYLGDPDFFAVPQRELLAPDYLDGRAKLMRPEKSLGVAPPGHLPQRDALSDDRAPEIPATAHLSIVDAQGNAVAMTTSVEDAFGSRTLVDGFLLNNQLTDFSFSPSDDGRPAANRVQPGKRPLSSMAPTMVFDRHGRLVAVLGSPGGQRIINYVAQALVALLDWKMAPEAAVALPHFGSRNGPTELEQGEFADRIGPALQRLGEATASDEMTSGLEMIVRRGKAWVGAVDPRREGLAGGE